MLNVPFGDLYVQSKTDKRRTQRELRENLNHKARLDEENDLCIICFEEIRITKAWTWRRLT